MRRRASARSRSTYTAGADTTAPTIIERHPAPGATGVDRVANVEVVFSESMNPRTIDGSSVRLRAQGAGADVAATVSYSGDHGDPQPGRRPRARAPSTR